MGKVIKLLKRAWVQRHKVAISHEEAKEEVEKFRRLNRDSEK